MKYVYSSVYLTIIIYLITLNLLYSVYFTVNTRYYFEFYSCINHLNEIKLFHNISMISNFQESRGVPCKKPQPDYFL